ncbi:type II secretion system F family protein [Bermanella marisrubri]|uniref:Type II secretory pathway, component PulF n=1 Tax=Bermanella marisrubri TaxID=207949 RepID=Q1MZP8_9GAMM|nr:type II secretion system F family protein [Bermanella marisrubri]EAT11509.1 Type II secretory pathway, component PulF [Oceanobacter sp. RED65] [Bermanella marisrubri]QIZ85083.1 type II secretion system F family protein [Bermanella marisrubri]
MAKTKTVTFQWEGLNKRGQKVDGEMLGDNPALVKAQLRKQGINPKKVRRKQEGLFGIGGGQGKGKVKPADVTLFMRQLATMAKSGVPLMQGLEIVADGLENPAMQKVVLSVKDEVSAGNDFASCLKKHPQHFDSLTCALIESGEQSGALEQMLDRVALYKEKSEALKQKVSKALKYPIVTLIIAAIVTVILLVKVVPTFESMFSSLGGDLPAPTQMVVNISEWMQANYLILLGAIITFVFGTKEAIKRSPKLQEQKDRLILKMPVIGEILKKSAVARFGRVLSTTFAAGVPLVDALESVAEASGNVVYRDAILRIRDDVSTGTQMNASIRATGVFPNMVAQMVAIGEESGALDAMLEKVASYYEEEVDNLVDGLTAMIEPIVMAFLGVVVGGLLIAMYLPIFSMGNAM